jgi:hypothetical protein
VFPVGPDKKALVKWEPYQKKLPTEDEIRQWWSKWPDANIGIATGLISGIAVIDIDDPDIGKAALAELIPDSLVFPIVKTPSGGEHWYFACTDGHIRNNAKIVPGCDLRANGGYVVAPPSINGNGKPWKWHDKLNPTKIALPYLPKEYVQFLASSSCSSRIPSEMLVSDKNVNNSTTLPVSNSVSNSDLSTNCLQSVYKRLQPSTSVYKKLMFEQGSRDEDIFHVANCLIKGKMPVPEISQVLEKIAQSCNPPFDLKEIPIKIESAIKRSQGRMTTLSQEIEDWVLSTTGNFLSTSIYSCLQLSTKDEHKNVSIILKRLLDKGVIEKFGDKNGSWRVVDNEAQTIDWYNADVKALDIKWPLGIEDFVMTLPKNIIVVAGTPNAGKTAFLLNVVKMNMGGNMPIHYFSSEMGSMEFKGRLQKFDVPLSKWRFNAKERASNFDDVIQPNDINIVDFLELSDKFYEVGGMLKKIYDKLQNGIAIIALQKNPGSSMARGGIGTLEKPRLYITMDSGVMKIEKGKNWRQPNVNPNGLQVRFSLVQGAKFILKDKWDYDKSKRTN